MCMDERVKWMRFLCMIVYMYDYVYICLIFQFKIGVKLKW
jgi:hypothetical protein